MDLADDLKLVGPSIEVCGEPYPDLAKRTVCLEAQILSLQQLALVGQLVSGVGHELNNYLSVVLGFSTIVLKRPELNVKSREDLEKVYNQGHRAAVLISHLLALARPGEFEKQYCDLNSLLEQCLALRTYDLKCNNVEVVRDFNPLPMVLVYPQQVQRAFLNILINGEQAIARAKRPGRIAISTRVTPGLHNSPGLVQVTFQDDGLPIPERYRSYAFDHVSVSEDSERSVGLHLNVARTLVQAQQGILSVESHETTGTLFAFEFPCSVATAVDPLAQS